MTVIKWSEYVKLLGNIPIRLYVGIMIFVSCVISYMLRTNLSINILAMVEPKSDPILNATDNSSYTSTRAPPPNYGERYSWTDHQVSNLLGAYFWGYLFSTLIGGFLADRFGPSTVILYTMFATCLTTLFAPLGASAHFLYIYVLRFLTGAFAGPLYPALQCLMSLWAPPNEKGKFMSAMMGGNFGTMITWPLVGLIIEAMGWVWGFYIPALLTAFASFFWWYNVSDKPSTHPRITEAEKKYIEDSFHGTVNGKKGNPPFLQLAKSLPFWSLLLLHYGSLWGMYFLLTAAPKFMNEVLGFNLREAGFLAALPYLMRMVCAFIFGSIGDAIMKTGRFSVTTIRKSFCVISHIFPGLMLISIIFLGHHPNWCIAIVSMSLGFNGCSTMTNLANGQDLAPNFAGSIYSLINFAGTTSGFLSPLVVTYFTQDGNTLSQWNNVFLVGAVVYIIPAIIFMCFGSGEVQPWNDPEKTTNPKDDSPAADLESRKASTVTRL